MTEVGNFSFQSQKSDAELEKFGYFQYLVDIIGDICPQTELKMDNFLLLLHQIPFYALVSNDENRISDALYLRKTYANRPENYRDLVEIGMYLNGEASVLEVLVALADRWDRDILYNYEYGIRSNLWFWEIIQNLFETGYDCDLNDLSDDFWDEDMAYLVAETVENWVNRAYSRDGFGGIFPLKQTKIDQRKIEIWSQMGAYTNENIGRMNDMDSFI